MNIKFNYLYRDAGNYKQYGSVTFANPQGIPVDEIERNIRAALIDGEFFRPKQWEVPNLHGYEWDDELDHDWHEFERVEGREDGTNPFRSIDEFLDTISRRQHAY